MSNKRIAITPFQNLNPADQKTQRLISGLRSNLLSVLAGQGDFKVFAESYDPYQNPQSVDFIINGSFAKVEDKMSALLTISNASDNQAVMPFSVPIAKLFQLEKKISKWIATELNGRPNRFGDTSTDDLSQTGYENLLLARYYAKRITPAGTAKAMDYFRLVLKEYPHYSLALSGIAAAAFQQLRYGFDGVVTAATIKEWVDAALKADPENVEAYTVQALLTFYVDKDLYTAGVSFENALALARDYVSVFKEYCWLFLAVGQDQAALEAIDKALEFDPLSVELICIKAEIWRYQEQYEEAIKYYNKAFQYNNTYIRCLEGLAICHAYLGRKDTAYHYLEVFQRQTQTEHWKGWVNFAIGQSFNDRDLIETGIKRLQEYAARHPEVDLSAEMMIIHAQRNPDLAMAHLKSAYDRGIGLVSILRYPKIKNLRERPDFIQLTAGLVKNISPRELKQSRASILHIKSDLSESLTVQRSAFVYAQADGNYTKIFHLKNGLLSTTMLRLKLAHLAKQLDRKSFLRVHNSYLVNLAQPEVELKGNAHKAVLKLQRFDISIPVSRKIYPQLR